MPRIYQLHLWVKGRARVCKERATTPAGLRAAARRGAAAGICGVAAPRRCHHIACVAAPCICPPGARAKAHHLFHDRPLPRAGTSAAAVHCCLVDADRRNLHPPEPVCRYVSNAPFGTSSVKVTRTGFSPALAATIMPFDSNPISLTGFRLATTTTFLLSRSDGS